MGIFSAKCSQCWDSIPCCCQEQRARDISAQRIETDQLREQIARLQKAVEQQCRFNCDAESHCTCGAHKRYRALVGQT